MIFNRLFFVQKNDLRPPLASPPLARPPLAVQKNDLRPPLALALLGPCSPTESLNY